MRIHYGSGYRVYFMQSNLEIVILLAGGQGNRVKART